MEWNVFDPRCPTRALLDRIGDKWTVMVVVALRDGPVRFGELRRATGGPAAKVLTSTVRSLERDGVLSRTVFTESPLRVEYELTPLGESLLATLERVRDWAEDNMGDVLDARSRYDDQRSAVDSA